MPKFVPSLSDTFIYERDRLSDKHPKEAEAIDIKSKKAASVINAVIGSENLDWDSVCGQLDEIFNQGLSPEIIKEIENLRQQIKVALTKGEMIPDQIDPYKDYRKLLEYYKKIERDLFEKEEFRRGMRLCDEALGLRPHDKHLINLRIMGFLKFGYYEDCLEECRMALEMYPEEAGLLNHAGTTHLQMAMHAKQNKDEEEARQNADKAIEYLERSVAVEREGNALSNLGIVYSLLGRHNDAVKLYDEVIEQSEGAWKASTYLNKAAALNRLGRKREAIACVDLAVKAAPEDSTILYNCFLRLDSIGDHKGAKGLLNKLINMPDANPNTLYNAACAAEQLGYRKEMLSALRLAVKDKESSIDVKTNCVRKFVELNLRDEALNALNSLLSRSDLDAKSLYNLAQLCAQLSLPDEMTDSLKRISDLKPEHVPPEIYMVVTQLFKQLGLQDEAQKMAMSVVNAALEQLRNEGPQCKDPSVYIRLAQLLIRMNEPDKCVELLQAILEMDEVEPEILEDASKIFTALGREAEAMQALLKAGKKPKWQV